MEIPCDETDRSIFAAATRISLGDGQMANFRYSAWLGGEALKDIAPKIFEISNRKNQIVPSTLQNGRWIQDINLGGGIDNPSHPTICGTLDQNQPNLPDTSHPGRHIMEANHDMNLLVKIRLSSGP